jgi:hypothetical protein
MNTPSLDDALCTPTKSTANDGAGADNHNDSTESENSSDSDLPPTKQKTRRTPLDYVLIKQWVTGEKASMEEEDIENEMFNAARDYMSVSLLRKLPNHFSKPTDFYLWQQVRDWTTKRGVRNRFFHCPMRFRCGCTAGIRIMEGPGWKQLHKFGEHDASSHKEDKSKYLKHEQIIAVSDAVLIAPQQSAAQLRRNLSMAGPSSPGKLIKPALLRSVQRRVSRAREQLTVQKMDGFVLDASYGSLSQLAEAKWFRSLVERNNDLDNELHFNTKAENDILYSLL